MISKNEQKRLKKLLGHQYAKEVSAILKRKKITNKFGVAHSAEYIRMVFQGYRKNTDIERAIIDLAIQRKKEKDSLLRSKSNLFE